MISILNRIAPIAVLAVGGLALWTLFDMALIGPRNAALLEADALQGELAGLVERGQSALQALKTTPAVPPIAIASADGAMTLNLQEFARDATISAGGSLISSQMADGGASALVRARFDEQALLSFTHAVEVAPGNIRFLSYEVHPVPVPQGMPALELTAMLGLVAQSAN